MKTLSAQDRLTGIIEKAGRTRLFAAIMKRIAPSFDLAYYDRLGGRVLGAGPPVLLLTTVGRKSGKERTSPLLYIQRGEQIVVAASNWGQKHHPDWSENLLDNPEVQVLIGEKAVGCRARLASPQEKAELWPRLLEIWPAYDTYQQRSGREIRVFILEFLE